jgi:anti-sigma B factor antagonist
VGKYRLVRPRSGAVVIELYGEHDLVTSARLGTILGTLVSSHDLVVVDLSETEFIDSTVLLALVQADRQARENGSAFGLQLGTEHVVRKALEITNLLDRLEHHPTREEALADGSGPAR